MVMVDPTNQENAEFELDWGLPDSKIVRRFEQWIKTQRPAGTSPHRRGVKSNSVRVNLERLGIMRLLHHYSRKEIRETMPDAWKLLSQREYFKDRKKAKKEFDRLFPRYNGQKLIPVCWLTKNARSK